MEEQDPSTESIRQEIEGFFTQDAPDPARASSLSFLREHPDFYRDLEASAQPPKAGFFPDQVGPYQLRERLGTGGMGVVFLGRQTESGHEVAVKLAPLSESTKVSHLRREADGLGRVNHPNVVRLIDEGTDRGFAWMATELVRGRTLAEHIRQYVEGDTTQTFSVVLDEPQRRPSRPPEPPPKPHSRAWIRVVIGWFRDVARALGALHEVGLIHRDVKPSNIVIGDDDRPRLIDFGLAREEGGTWNVQRLLAGTVPYMSPEQTLGGGMALAPSSDLYSLAVTFHETLCGRRVAEEGGQSEMLKRIAFLPVPSPSRVAPGVPRSLDPIFEKALAKHPSDRYETAAEMAEDLDCWLEDRPLRHARETVRLRASRLVRRHPVTAGMAALLVLAGLGAGGTAWWRARHEAARVEALRREGLRLGDEARALLRAGQPEEALARLVSEGARFTGQRGQAELWDDVLAAVAPLRTRRLLQKVGFALSYNRSGTLHEQIARDAARWFERRRDPHFLFQMGFHLLLVRSRGSKDPALERAQELLDRHPALVDSHPLLLELRAFVQLERGMIDEMLETERLLGRVSSMDLTAGERCVRGVRLIGRSLVDREKATTLGKPKEDLDESEEIVRPAADDPQGHLLARSARGLLRCQQGRFADALEDFLWVRANIEDVERGAAEAWSAAAALRQACKEPGSDAAWTRAVDLSLVAAGTEPALLHWLLTYVVQECEEVNCGKTWYARVLPDPADRERALRLLPATAFWAALHLYPESRDYARSIQLAKDAEALWDPGLSPMLREFYDELQRIQSWALYFEAPADKSVEAVARRAARIREIVDRELARRPRLTYDLRAVAALAGKLEAESAGSSEDRRRLQDRTRRELEGLLDPSVVEAEKRKAIREYETGDAEATRSVLARALGDLDKNR